MIDIFSNHLPSENVDFANFRKIYFLIFLLFKESSFGREYFFLSIILLLFFILSSNLQLIRVEMQKRQKSLSLLKLKKT